jgi:hypothetical protein
MIEIASWLRRVTPRSHEEAERIAAVVADLESTPKKERNAQHAP